MGGRGCSHTGKGVFEADEVIRVAPQQVNAGAAGKILINLYFPEGSH
jgi:hypothetical protein